MVFLARVRQWVHKIVKTNYKSSKMKVSANETASFFLLIIIVPWPSLVDLGNTDSIEICKWMIYE